MVRESTSESTWFLTGKEERNEIIRSNRGRQVSGRTPVRVNQRFVFHVCMSGWNTPQGDAIAIIFFFLYGESKR